MCTLAVAFGSVPGVPLIVAANRDERLDRASSGPMRWAGPPRFVAPRDEVAGGTWLGLNEHGVFVGITNRAGTPRDPTRRSRGALVLDALRARSAAETHAALADVRADAHNPFHLLYADSHSAHLTWTEGETIHRADLQPGLTVVTERSPGVDAGNARTRRICEAWTRLPTRPSRGPTPESIRGLLAEHDHDHPLDAVCVHADAVGYGTRSSMLLVLPDDPREVGLWWAEGKPCQTPFTNLSPLPRALFE